MPRISQIHDFSLTRRHAGDRGPLFYADALRYAQSQWISGKPAQAILQLDKAWMADLDGSHPVLDEFPPPYEALAWILRQSAGSDCGYLGNPVRHFQHLASRMSGPRGLIRSWRAWYCLHLAENILPSPMYPRDGLQLAREGIRIPGVHSSLHQIFLHGWHKEADIALLAMR